MYRIFSYICLKNCPNVGKYSIHGASGLYSKHWFPADVPFGESKKWLRDAVRCYHDILWQSFISLQWKALVWSEQTPYPYMNGKRLVRCHVVIDFRRMHDTGTGKIRWGWMNEDFYQHLCHHKMGQGKASQQYCQSWTVTETTTGGGLPKSSKVKLSSWMNDRHLWAKLASVRCCSDKKGRTDLLMS